MTTFYRIRALTCVCLCIATTSAWADTDQAAASFSQGTRAFFQRDYEGAVEKFSAALNDGYKTPTCYYFRGIAKHRIGQKGGARFDFEEGARIEASTYDNSVGQMLERVQGGDRVILRRYRERARLVRDELATYSQRILPHSQPLNVIYGIEYPAAPAVSVVPTTVPAASAYPTNSNEIPMPWFSQERPFAHDYLPPDPSDPFSIVGDGYFLVRGPILDRRATRALAIEELPTPEAQMPEEDTDSPFADDVVDMDAEFADEPAAAEEGLFADDSDDIGFGQEEAPEAAPMPAEDFPEEDLPEDQGDPFTDDEAEDLPF